MANSKLIITNEGLQTANEASPFGPFIHITGVRLGDAYDYTPQRTDTGLNGNEVYRTIPLSYRNLGNGVMDIVLRIPPDAGPFEFGEIGIYNSKDNGVTETLFAKCALERLVLKESSLGSPVAATYTIHALLKLEQSVAVFKIDALMPTDVYEVDLWSDVLVPQSAPYDDATLLLVKELDGYNNSSLLHTSDPVFNKWTIGTTYSFYRTATVTAATATSVTVSGTFGAADFGTQDRRYVLEIAGRVDPYRASASFASASGGGRFVLRPAALSPVPSVGTQVRIYEANQYPRPIVVTEDTTSITLQGDGSTAAPLKATAKISTEAKNSLEIRSTGLYSKGVEISPDAGNRIEERANGIGVWDTAPPDLAFQYVSTSGNDANPGTKAQPLRTLREALNRIPPNNNGSFTIKLKAGQSFPLDQNFNLSGAVQITVYDDPKYGEADFIDYNPLGLATDCTRPILNCSVYVGDGGYVYPARLICATQLILKGLIINCNPNITAPTGNVHFNSPATIFWGCLVNVGVGARGWAVQGTNASSVHTDWNIASNGSALGFELQSLQRLFNRTPGSIVPAAHGYPAWTVRGTNIQSVVNYMNVGNTHEYNVATQSLFGIMVNWNIFE